MTVGGVRTSLSRRSALAAAIATLSILGATSAWADQGQVDLQVIDRDSGQPLRVWRHHGRLYVAGEPGRRYGLRLINNTDGRVLMVVSVDGVNIISGETAAYDQTGYVLAPYQSDDIVGWRKSASEVAAFSFAPLPQSYAARTGRPTNVGVIGMAAFREKVVPPVAAIAPPSAKPSQDAARLRAPAPPAALQGAPTMPSPAPQRVEEPRAASPRGLFAPGQPNDTVITAQRRDERLGTAHGAREWSVSQRVAFERATRYPQIVRQIEYDTYANLAAEGVIATPPYAYGRPRPFPSRPSGQGYVPDPPSDF